MSMSIIHVANGAQWAQVEIKKAVFQRYASCMHALLSVVLLSMLALHKMKACPTVIAQGTATKRSGTCSQVLLSCL